MIVNQDCQCNSQTAKAFVSSHQEYFIGNELIGSESPPYPAEFGSFFQKMQNCQELVNNDRFFCYGQVSADGSHCMVLFTEFKQFSSEIEFWNMVEWVQQQTAAHLWVVDTEYESDYSWMGVDAEGNYERCGQSERQLMQVELSWRIEKLSYNDIVSLAERMAVATKEIWDASHAVVC